MTRPEVADARPEEAAHLPPAGRDRPAQQREADADVELPRGARNPGRHEEVEHRDPPTGPNDARQLPHGRHGFVDVTEEVRERERVEPGVLEGQLLGSPLAELDPLSEAGTLDPCLPGGEHLRALVDSDDAASVTADEVDRDRGG